MAEGLKTPPLTQLEFTPADHEAAERIAKALGYEQYAYTSTSSLWGLFCLPENPATWRGNRNALQHRCIINTKEFGFLVVQTCDDLHLTPRGRRQS